MNFNHFLSVTTTLSGEEGPVAGEGGESPTPEGEPAGGPQEEAGGTEAEGRETSSSAGGETETEARKEQGRTTQSLTPDAAAQNQNQHNFKSLFSKYRHRANMAVIDVITAAGKCSITNRFLLLPVKDLRPALQNI